MRRRVAASLIVLALAAVACSSGDDTSTSGTTTGDPAGATEDVVSGDDLSIVVIGDSVAAGEGIAYGYSYDYDSSSPKSSHWTGGNENPTWQGDYQLCHDDAQAYGEVVASSLGASLAKFACTGATYLNGITVEQTTGSGSVQQVLRPAQFGDWSTKQNLNPDYDSAEPDVVVLTFGADDVSFVPVVKYCVLGFEPSEDEAIAGSNDPVAAIEEAVGQKGPQLAEEANAAKEQGGPPPETGDASVCTKENPGATIEKLFWEPINSGAVAQHYQDIVTAIQDRGKDPSYGNGKVPEIVFTTYHRPLPEGLDGDCWDVWPLSSAEQQYLQSLQETLQTTLVEAVKGLEGVSVADISDSIEGHEWCTEDPWAYGLSIINYEYDTSSQAPFHPTPKGQEAIAAIVESTIKSAVGGS